jgi:VIT1/CCC1 family predicted Fe2+/Mn2+ transporter
MVIPDFLTHYYEQSTGPFSNLSMLPIEQAEQILEGIRRDGNRFASRRSSDDLRQLSLAQGKVKMNTALWIIQIILGIKLINVSYTHGLQQSKATMQQAIERMGQISRPLLYLVAVGTLIAAIGLLLPGVLGWSRLITPVTAMLLSLMLLCSIFCHIKSREKPNLFVSVVLFAFAAFVAYGRWVIVPR